MYKWLNENSRLFLERGYLLPGATPESRIREIAETAEKILGKKGYADKFEKYMQEGYYALSSPVWSNFGNDRGLPISCFTSFVGDNMGDILFTQAEVGMMSKFGGGCGGYFGDLRPRGATISDNGHSSGAVHFMQLRETLIDVVSQGSVRRGHFAPYLPISHPDIGEFLKIGTEGNPIQKLTHGVCVDDAWIESMIAGDSDKRTLRAELIQRRSEVGYPYIFFSDNVNDNTVDVYKEGGHTIYSSNMCSEIMLPTSTDRSFVCCLSAMNLVNYDAWKDTDAVETLTYFLDAVMSEFITKLEKLRDSDDKEDTMAFFFMQRAYKFAVENRALGLGTLGWHSLLQSKMLAFESEEAMSLNTEVFKLLQQRTYAASEAMAKEFGEPKILEGYGRRNTTTMAIAPNTSSSFIMAQVSQGIEPIWSNYYVKDVAKAKVSIKNSYLEDVLEAKGHNTREVRQSIRDNDGSVKNLDLLSDHEKDVFKTFAEINQFVVIDQAAERQKYIDQGQSLNIMINPQTPVKDINALYLDAWRQGIKSLYYQHSMNAAQQLSRQIKCSGCDG